MLDDVAAYLVMSPIAVIAVGAILAAVWAYRRRPTPVGIRPSDKSFPH